MPRWQDFLERFRPITAPGAAGPAPVPADRAREASAELIPVLARLDAVQDEADRLRAAGALEAERIRAAGLEQAATIRRRAQDRVPLVTEEAAAQQITTSVAAPSDAAADAATVRSRAAQRTPELVELVVTRARALLDEIRTAAAPEPDR